jgi:hypothetical protein
MWKHSHILNSSAALRAPEWARDQVSCSPAPSAAEQLNAADILAALGLRYAAPLDLGVAP